MLKRAPAVLLIALFATLTFAEDRVRQPKLTPQNSDTTQGLIAVSPVNERVVWASGRGGTFVVTTDGGRTWRSGVVPGAEALQLRDVEGVSDRVAYVQSIGDNPTDFRIYKTTDGGATWTMQFQNQLAGGFYDCFAFWTPRVVFRTATRSTASSLTCAHRNGRTWESISANMPPALPGESSFASSGTCVATEGRRNAWIATGGSTAARSSRPPMVLHHHLHSIYQKNITQSLSALLYLEYTSNKSVFFRPLLCSGKYHHTNMPFFQNFHFQM